MFTRLSISPKTADARRPSDFDIRYPDGTPYTGRLFSASAISSYQQCERRWAYQYLDKLPRKTTAAQQKGVNLHAQLEAWLKHGTPPSDALIVDSGLLRHFPSPGMGKAEAAFAFVHTSTATGFWGFKDAEVVDPAHVGFTGVYDLKTTRDIIWAKSPEELATDTQGVLYALDHLLQRGPRVEHADLRWVYCATAGKKQAKAVHARVSAEQVKHQFESAILPAARNMLRILDAESGKVLTPPALHGKVRTPTAKACGAYGGCEFREHCGDVNPVDVAKSAFAQMRAQQIRKVIPQTPISTTPEQGEDQMNLMDKLKAMSAAKGNTEQVAAAVASAPVIEVRADVVDKPAAAAAPASASSSKIAGALAGLRKTATVAEKPAVVYTAPPEEAKPSASPAVTVTAAEVVVQENATAAAPASAESAEAVEKRGRGRPKGSTKKTLVEVAASTLAPPVGGFILYLDVVPVKGARDRFRDVEDLIAPARAMVEREAGDLNYRLFEFGKGPSVLAAQLEADFKTNPPVGEFVAMSKVLDKEVLALFIRQADEVIKGTW